MKTFSLHHLDELLHRRKMRQRREREEKKHEKSINEINDRQMGKLIKTVAAMNVNIDSMQQFPECGMDEMPALPSTSSPALSSSPAASAGPSFANVSSLRVREWLQLFPHFFPCNCLLSLPPTAADDTKVSKEEVSGISLAFTVITINFKCRTIIFRHEKEQHADHKQHESSISSDDGEGQWDAWRGWWRCWGWQTQDTSVPSAWRLSCVSLAETNAVWRFVENRQEEEEQENFALLVGLELQLGLFLTFPRREMLFGWKFKTFCWNEKISNI